MIGFINSAAIQGLENKATNEVKTVLNQDSAHESRSSRYSLVKTSDLIDMFAAEGFQWKLVAEEKSRKASYKGFGTHMVRLECPELLSGDSLIDQELKPVLYLRNSYHGRTRLRLDLGFFRFACMNGLFVGKSLKAFSKKHIGMSQDQIHGIFLEMREAFKEAVPVIRRLMTTELTQSQQLEMAKAALAERMISLPNYVGGEHEKLLTINRVEDNGNTAWQVLNRIQENLGLNFGSSPVEMTYSVEVVDKNNVVQTKERKLRRISGIAEITRMNQSVFDIALNAAA